MKNPLQGNSLGHGVRKVRMPITSKGKGKSGSARVLTLTILISDDALGRTRLNYQQAALLAH